MGHQGIYLDSNATTIPLGEVVAAVTSTMQSLSRNPASAHSAGAQARRTVEAARDEISRSFEGAEAEGIIFLSGGTEANNTVVKSFAGGNATFLAAPVEHSSLIEPLRQIGGDRVAWLKVDEFGRVDIDDACNKARAAIGRVVLTVQAANGETGVVQPVGALVEAVRHARDDVFVHVDAAQALGRIPLSLHTLGADTLSFSAHKLHGPMGVGALLLRDPEEDRVSPLIHGGGQERGRRSGTLNVPSIVGMAKALEMRRERFAEANKAMAVMRDAFEGALSERLGDRVVANGGGADRVSNTSNIRFERVEGMRLLAALDQAGIMASLGSACSSGRPEPSSVLTAMGLSETQAYSSVRFSFSVLNTLDEVLRAAETVAQIAEEISK